MTHLPADPLAHCATTPCCCRRAVPLALALLNVSSPDMTVMDTLSRLSHDTGAQQTC